MNRLKAHGCYSANISVGNVCLNLRIESPSFHVSEKYVLFHTGTAVFTGAPNEFHLTSVYFVFLLTNVRHLDGDVVKRRHDLSTFYKSCQSLLDFDPTGELVRNLIKPETSYSSKTRSQFPIRFCYNHFITSSKHCSYRHLLSSQVAYPNLPVKTYQIRHQSIVRLESYPWNTPSWMKKHFQSLSQWNRQISSPIHKFLLQVSMGRHGWPRLSA